jgi:hypothetical protein
MFRDTLFVLLATVFMSVRGAAQQTSKDSADLVEPPKHRFFSLTPATTLDKKRLWVTASTGAVIYGAASAGLWNAWYKDYPLSGFHLFNDWGEWNNMDKSGHFFSTYQICNYAFKGSQWTGMKRQSAMWTSVGVGMGIMTTVEVMDGFSEKWGFSLGDIAFNTAGAGLFVSQELLWKEQRILLKVSGVRPHYSQESLFSTDGTAVTTLDERAGGLYGTNFFHVILKDYNALTAWSSVNIHAFMKNKASKFPAWLNVAVGYGAGNLYGGFENKWTTAEGTTFELDRDRYPRYRQFYLSPDIDWSRIPVKRKWIKFALGLFNWLKFPAPAMEVNTLGKVKFHCLHW